jgi:hypothetical protein
MKGNRCDLFKVVAVNPVRMSRVSPNEVRNNSVVRHMNRYGVITDGLWQVATTQYPGPWVLKSRSRR